MLLRNSKVWFSFFRRSLNSAARSSSAQTCRCQPGRPPCRPTPPLGGKYQPTPQPPLVRPEQREHSVPRVTLISHDVSRLSSALNFPRYPQQDVVGRRWEDASGAYMRRWAQSSTHSTPPSFAAAIAAPKQQQPAVVTAFSCFVKFPRIFITAFTITAESRHV